MLSKFVIKLVTKCNFTENCNNLAKLIHSEDETCSGHCSKHQKDIHWSYIWHFKSTKFNDISLLYTCQRQKIGSLSSISRSVMLWKGLFRTLTNIIDWESCKNIEQMETVNYFPKVLHLIILSKFWIRLCHFTRLLNLGILLILKMCSSNLQTMIHHNWKYYRWAFERFVLSWGKNYPPSV